MAERIEELKRLAEAAVDQPWNSHERLMFDDAANPQTILALIRRCEELEAALEPFAEYAAGAPSAFPDNAIITVGSPLARRQLTLGDCRLPLRMQDKR